MTITFASVLNESRDSLKLDILEDGVPVVYVQLDALDIATLIEQLATQREDMAEEVPMQLDPIRRVVAMHDPAWTVEPQEGMKVVSLRHPGLGWLTFALPDQSAQEMAKWLSTPARHQGK